MSVAHDPSPSKSMRSPLGKVRGLGSAKSGTAHWAALRMAALILIPLSLYVMTGFVNVAAGGSYGEAMNWLRSPVDAGAVLLFLLAGLYHGAAGMKEIIEDYVHGGFAKSSALFVTNLTASLLAAIGTLAIAKICIGS